MLKFDFFSSVKLLFTIIIKYKDNYFCENSSFN